MKIGALLLALTLLLGAGEVEAVSAADAASIVRASLSNDIAYARSGHTVCVQGKLEPPLQRLRERTASNGSPLPSPQLTWLSGGKPLDAQVNIDLNSALSAAVAGHASNGLITEIPSVPAPLILNPTRHRRKECDSEGPQDDKSPFTVFLTQPVIVGEFAFVEHGYVCGGECGSGQLQAFKKMSGRWVLVARANTWIA